MPVIPALGRLRQEDYELETTVDYIARSCLKKEKSHVKVHISLFLCIHKVVQPSLLLSFNFFFFWLY
jgi:hypothetical protein